MRVEMGAADSRPLFTVLVNGQSTLPGQLNSLAPRTSVMMWPFGLHGLYTITCLHDYPLTVCTVSLYWAPRAPFLQADSLTSKVQPFFLRCVHRLPPCQHVQLDVNGIESAFFVTAENQAGGLQLYDVTLTGLPYPAAIDGSQSLLSAWMHFAYLDE